MREKINNIFLNIFVLFIIIFWFICVSISLFKANKREGEYKNQEEKIKQLEQSLQEQIQETEVYRDILEEYQIEGIINE